MKKLKLYDSTLTPSLLNVIDALMASTVFEKFRLVGGTALSLQRGHRISVDVDLFTDEEYGTMDFETIDIFLKNNWDYVDSIPSIPIAFGKSYFMGSSADDCVKLDLYYTDTFIRKQILIDGFRLASIEEIIAMKMDVILRGWRKKDFWDLHELSDDYSFEQMAELHKMRYPYLHDREKLFRQFTNFKSADNDFDPICLLGKHWELIKLDMIRFVSN